MKQFIASFLFVITVITAPARAEGTNLVVVELFTSQGCSSCPPADAFLGELSQREDVIALGLHVDYWDYLGWRDQFAKAEFTRRQEIYNARLKSRYRLVTPQLVIQGAAQVAGGTGNSPILVREYIEKLRAMERPVTISLQREANILRVMFSPLREGLKTADIHVVQYTPRKEVGIRAGENRGRSLTYSNVVTRWQTVTNQPMSETLELRVPEVESEDQTVLIVQSVNMGPILAAIRLQEGLLPQTAQAD